MVSLNNEHMKRPGAGVGSGLPNLPQQTPEQRIRHRIEQTESDT
jgi:hypothetical protein